MSEEIIDEEKLFIKKGSIKMWYLTKENFLEAKENLTVNFMPLALAYIAMDGNSIIKCRLNVDHIISNYMSSIR